MQLFDVVSHADEAPFAFYCLEAPQQKASEPHDRFDDAKNRFGSDFEPNQRKRWKLVEK